MVAVFDDDHVLLDAVREGNRRGFSILDAFTPFPVHGIEKAMGIKRSNLGVAAFFFGMVGTTLALTLTWYSMRFDWPVNIGGKPTWPLLSFIPITFELTVLIASLGMAFTFYWISKILPGVIPVLYDKRQTNDRFVVLYKDNGNAEEIKAFALQNGAIEARNDLEYTHNFPGPLPIKLRLEEEEIAR